MLFRCYLLLFCLTAITAQKGGGRKALASESSPVRRLALAAGRKTAPSEPIEQVQEPDRDPDEDREAVSALKPSRPQPTDDGSGVEGHAAPEPYSFSYSVEDPESGAASSREETQDASGEIVGYYHIKDQDGRSRRVDYTAGKDGFKASIKSNEEGLNSRAPADVKVELTASPSERVPQYAPNNRPLASEASIKSYGKPVQSKFYQKLLPTSTTRLPPPPPPPQEEQSQDTQTYESQNDPEITQQRNLEEDEIPFESVKGGPDAPPPQPTPQRFQPTSRPVGTYNPIRSQTYSEQGLVNLQPIQYQPQVQYQPQIQYQDDIPQNSVQEVQQTLEVAEPPPPPPAPTKTIPSAPILPPPRKGYAPPRPQPQQLLILGPRPVLPQIQPARPLAIPPQQRPPIKTSIQSPRKAFTIQTYSAPPPPPPPRQTIVSYPPPPPPPPAPAPPAKTRPVLQYRSSVVEAPPPPPAPESVPLPPPSNNIIFGQQHREPITQQQLLQFFQPLNNQPFSTSPQQPIVFDATPPRAINLFSSLNNEGQTLMSYIPPQSQQTPQIPQAGPGYRIVVHREQDTYQLPPQVIQQGGQRQEIITQEQVREEPQQEQIVQEPIRRLPPPPPPPPISLPPLSYSPPSLPPLRPLPTPPSPPRRQVFEPQVYEPQTQQTYEPLQQVYEPTQQVYEPPQQALDSVPDVVVPQPRKCDCQEKTEQTVVSYGIKGSQSEPAPVKGRVSPSRSLNLFLPQAFRTRRDSTNAENDSVQPSGTARAGVSFSVIDPNEAKSEAN